MIYEEFESIESLNVFMKREWFKQEYEMVNIGMCTPSWDCYAKYFLTYKRKEKKEVQK